MKQILYVLLLALLIISCKKTEDDSYTITGLVLDWDTRTPIAGAKVYVSQGFNQAEDSAISDGNGKVSFTYLKTDSRKNLSAYKQGYVYPLYSSIFIIPAPPPTINRTDSLFLARPSNLNVTMHKMGIYNSTDSIRVIVSGFRRAKLFINGDGMGKTDIFFLYRPAVAADTSMIIPSVYFAPPYQKAYINSYLIRNGSLLSSNTDSTDLTQFGTKNYNLNY